MQIRKTEKLYEFYPDPLSIKVLSSQPEISFEKIP